MTDTDRGNDCRGDDALPAEEAPEEEVARLRQALRERIEFIEDMSHELRSGLTFIKGYVDLFVGGTLGPVSDKQNHALQVMERRTEGIVHLLDQMLSLERARSGHLELNEYVDVSEVVYHSAQTAAISAERAGVKLTVEAEPALMTRADPRRLIQVMDNLISNAIKFSYSGGAITIRCHRTGDRVDVSVQDEGVGIAPEELERVFERFYRTRRGADRASGSGLGLVITRAIVEAHSGRIWAESEVGKGTCFHIALPKDGPAVAHG